SNNKVLSNDQTHHRLLKAGIPGRTVVFGEVCVPGAHLAQAYASDRGSAPALNTPVRASSTIAPKEVPLHGPVTVSLCPFALRAARTDSATRDSTDRSPGCIVCGKGEAGKLRVDQ